MTADARSRPEAGTPQTLCAHAACGRAGCSGIYYSPCFHGRSLQIPRTLAPSPLDKVYKKTLEQATGKSEFVRGETRTNPGNESNQISKKK